PPSTVRPRDLFNGMPVFFIIEASGFSVPMPFFHISRPIYHPGEIPGDPRPRPSSNRLSLPVPRGAIRHERLVGQTLA
ncbi:hypothetical protein U1Q18_013735, partial [Sarracenia purpurea var. burkii]